MKSITRYIVIILIVSFASLTVSAKGNEFKDVVNHLKKNYHAKQMRIPFVFGLVGLGARIYTRGAVKGLKIAIFPDQDFSNAVKDRQFESVFANSFDSNWTPMIRTFSRKDGQRTYIYAKEAGKDFQILLTAIEQDSAVVLTLKLNPAQLAKFIEKHSNNESIIGELGLGKRKNKNDTNNSTGAVNDDQKTETKATETVNDTTVVADAPVKKLPEIKGENDSPATTPTVAAEPVIKADISIDTKLVNLNARVLNNSGKPLTTLQKENFTLYENNVRQEISHFSPVTSPINLVLLLDFSGSTEKKKNVIKEAAKKFVDSLGPNDRVAVAAFARKFYLTTDFNSDKKWLKKLIGDIKVPSSGTAYYDAMWKTMDLFSHARGSRNAIVVLTDGVDNSISSPRMFPPMHNFNALFERIAEEDVTIYPMYLDTEYETVVKRHGSDTHETYAIARKQLAQIAEQTGGLVFNVSNIEDLHGVYQRVADELKTLYSIAYSSNNEDGNAAQKKQWREIKLVVDQKESVTRTKRGYYSK